MENTTTRARVSQRNGNMAYGQPSPGNGYPYPNQPGNPVTGSGSGTGEEVIDEVTGANESNESDESGDFSTGPSGGEATPMTVTDGHAPMSSPSYRATPPRNGEADGGGACDESAADEAADTESVYEAVEGWEEAQPTESGEGAEPSGSARLTTIFCSTNGSIRRVIRATNRLARCGSTVGKPNRSRPAPSPTTLIPLADKAARRCGSRAATASVLWLVCIPTARRRAIRQPESPKRYLPT